MADKKRKSRDEPKKKKSENTKKKMSSRKSNSKTLAGSSHSKTAEGVRKRSGPRLPNALKRDVDSVIPNPSLSDDEDDARLAGDVYEYEEEVPEEESRKNRRYDPVQNFEYELPEDFEDEDILSDDDNDEDDVNVIERRHSKLLHEVTGMPALVFEGKKRKKDVVISEAYPESEFNPTSDVLAGNANLSIQDLLEPLHHISGYGKLKKEMRKVDKEMPLQAPLSKAEQDRIQRAVVYEQSKKQLTKWEPLVKRNREAPTIYFDDNVDVGFSTVGAIASEFKPRTDFEKSIASLVHNDEVLEAERKDGAKLLELNKITAEEVKDRQNRLAKMRSLLFRHEMKAKHIKKIKSKTYHRLLKKERLKAAGIDMQMDPEAAKEFERKQEYKRAEERLTLKHKNKSKWAKRILERGLDIQEDGTRAAFQEQLREHERLKRKMNSMRDTSSSSSDEDGSDDSDGSDMEDASKLLDKASEKTKTLMDEDDEMPKSSVLSLPFMVRGMKKKKEAADEEARLALQDYEALKHKVDKTEVDVLNGSIASGRRVFGATQKQDKESKADHRPDIGNSRSDSEDDFDTAEELQTGHMGKDLQTDVNVDLNVLREDSETADDSLFKTIDDIVEEPGAKTAYDVSIFASGSWKKMNSCNKLMAKTDSRDNDQGSGEPALDGEQGEEPDEDSDSESDGQMIDGILSVGTKEKYELPSQEELIRRAFAGDDVEEEFERAKEEALSEENPKPEEPSTMPGWGQWASVKKKRGLPSWMREEHENAKKKREEALKKRKDAQLKHVIISEKVDKKAEKLHTKTLPYPFTSQEVFEQSIRMPIGPEFNPATSFRAINRPEVVKRPGVIIKPINFEEVNPHERAEDEQKKQTGRKRKAKGKGAVNNKKSK